MFSFFKMGNCRSKRNDSIATGGDNNKINDNKHNNSQTSQNNINTENEESIIIAQYNQSTGNSIKKKTNLDVIDSTKVEVRCLLERIHEFYGTSENDKNYRYVDEMLTRCILKLDQLNCNNVAERICRKTAITGVNQAITILEKKLEFNSDVKKLENKLSE